VAIGDVSGDGRPDLAVANYSSSTVSVLLGNGAGGFGAKTDFATGSFPYSVAIGDVSGDGRPDLAVANASASTVSVLLGNGAGGFGAKTDFATGAGSVFVAMGDVSGDGKPDLAVANAGASTVSVLLGNGAGGFGAKTDFTTGSSPYSVAIGDVSGDGRPDLAVANASASTVSVLLGTGAGGFGAKTDFTSGTDPISVAIGDVSGDGRPDLAVANQGSSTVSVLFGNGAGGFAAKTDFATGGGPLSVAIGDVSGDGRPDLAAANYSGTVSVLLGNGAGGFGANTDFTTGSAPSSVAIGDVSGDGRLDLAVANYNSNTVSVLLGLVPTRTALSVSPNPAVLGAPVTLTANVSIPAPGYGAPSDSVRFFDGTTLLGTSPVNGGVAGLALFAPYLGDRAITAVYKGDGRLSGSFSSAVTQKVVSTAAAAIASIADVKNDQGGQVRLTFGRSAYDYVGSGTPIMGYKLLRRAIVAGVTSASIARLRTAANRPRVDLIGWDELTTISATGDDGYQLVVPTLADSNGSGTHPNVFMVRALTATPTTYYDSPADSGYSVDNLPPVPPAPFTAAYVWGATHLHWGANSEPDLWHYRVYRGSSAAFVPGPGNLVTATADTGYVDAGAAGSYYKLAAVDVNGNVSAYTTLTPGGTADIAGGGPLAFALEPPASPTRGGRLGVRFTLPVADRADLELLDVSGRRVASREVMGAGRHEVALGEGQRAAAGIYFVRLTQGARVATRRVVVTE
jgi:hypothetical protein